MWKKSRNGLRIISFCLLFLVLGLSPLLAIPQWITGSASGEQIFLLKNTIAEKEQLIESMTEYVTQLEIQLDELEKISLAYQSTNAELENSIMTLRKQLENFKMNLEEREREVANLKIAYTELQNRLKELTDLSTGSENSDEVLVALVNQLETQLTASNESLQQAQSEIRSLQLNLTQLEELSGLSSESFQSLMSEYLPLREAYNQAIAERDQYYQEAVNAKAGGFIGEIGAKGLYYPDGNFGVGVSCGIGWGDVILDIGVDYKLILPFDITQLVYSAGLTYRF